MKLNNEGKGIQFSEFGPVGFVTVDFSIAALFTKNSGEGFVAIKLVMVSFPYNDSKYCNVNLSKIKVTFPGGE